MSSGPFIGEVMKHVSKHGPVYIRVTTEVYDESFKRWYISKVIKKIIIHQEAMMMKV